MRILHSGAQIMNKPEARSVAVALVQAIDQVVAAAKQVEVERRRLMDLLSDADPEASRKGGAS